MEESNLNQSIDSDRADSRPQSPVPTPFLGVSVRIRSSRPSSSVSNAPFEEIITTHRSSNSAPVRRLLKPSKETAPIVAPTAPPSRPRTTVNPARKSLPITKTSVHFAIQREGFHGGAVSPLFRIQQQSHKFESLGENDAYGVRGEERKPRPRVVGVLADSLTVRLLDDQELGHLPRKLPSESAFGDLTAPPSTPHLSALNSRKSSLVQSSISSSSHSQHQQQQQMKTTHNIEWQSELVRYAQESEAARKDWTVSQPNPRSYSAFSSTVTRMPKEAVVIAPHRISMVPQLMPFSHRSSTIDTERENEYHEEEERALTERISRDLDRDIHGKLPTMPAHEAVMQNIYIPPLRLGPGFGNDHITHPARPVSPPVIYSSTSTVRVSGTTTTSAATAAGGQKGLTPRVLSSRVHTSLARSQSTPRFFNTNGPKHGFLTGAQYNHPHLLASAAPRDERIATLGRSRTILKTEHLTGTRSASSSRPSSRPSTSRSVSTPRTHLHPTSSHPSHPQQLDSSTSAAPTLLITPHDHPHQQQLQRYNSGGGVGEDNDAYHKIAQAILAQKSQHGSGVGDEVRNLLDQDPIRRAVSPERIFVTRRNLSPELEAMDTHLGVDGSNRSIISSLSSDSDREEDDLQEVSEGQHTDNTSSRTKRIAELVDEYDEQLLVQQQFHQQQLSVRQEQLQRDEAQQGEVEGQRQHQHLAFATDAEQVTDQLFSDDMSQDASSSVQQPPSTQHTHQQTVKSPAWRARARDIQQRAAQPSFSRQHAKVLMGLAGRAPVPSIPPAQPPKPATSLAHAMQLLQQHQRPLVNTPVSASSSMNSTALLQMQFGRRRRIEMDSDGGELVVAPPMTKNLAASSGQYPILSSNAVGPSLDALHEAVYTDLVVLKAVPQPHR